MHPLHYPGKYIAFVGDSYCASWRGRLQEPWAKHQRLYQYHSNFDTALDLVPRYFSTNLAPYGFAGRSWWYSWRNFFDHWENRLQDLDAIIFFHTDSNRINNAWNHDLPNNIILEGQLSQFAEPDQNALKYYLANIHDGQFQNHAKRCHLQALRQLLPGIKLLHFFCFDHVTDETAALIPGTVFTDPLCLLSIGEFPVKKIQKKWIKYLASDATNPHRANHMDARNNNALSNLIIQHLIDYRPGARPLPLDKFYFKDQDEFVSLVDDGNYRDIFNLPTL